MWYKKCDIYILELGSIRSGVDHYVYFKLVSDSIMYLVLYVDDILLIENDREPI